MPLQIGAPDMAFPRLNALSYWLYLTGSITMLMSFFVAGGAAQFGWVAYAPLSSATSSPGAGPDLWIMALALTGFSAIFTGVNLCATIFYLRAPGMTMFRMPIFTWNMLVTGHPDPASPSPCSPRRWSCSSADRHFGTHIYTAVGCHLRQRTTHAHRAGHRCCGRTSSGSSAIPRSTSSPCRSSAS